MAVIYNANCVFMETAGERGVTLTKWSMIQKGVPIKNQCLGINIPTKVSSQPILKTDPFFFINVVIKYIHTSLTDITGEVSSLLLSRTEHHMMYISAAVTFLLYYKTLKKNRVTLFVFMHIPKIFIFSPSSLPFIFYFLNETKRKYTYRIIIEDNKVFIS